MSFFEQLLRFLWAHNTVRFFLIWIAITATAAICVATAVGQVADPRSHKTAKRPINLILTWRQLGTPRAVALLTILSVFLACYIAMILAWEDFNYQDNSSFTQFTLKGHNFPLQILPATGAFSSARRSRIQLDTPLYSFRYRVSCIANSPTSGHFFHSPHP